VLYDGVRFKPANVNGRAKIKKKEMEIFRTMIVGYTDKRVGYNTLWERSDEEME
jgi:hypothetical protein